MSQRRSTTRRDRFRREVRKGEPDCYLCGEPIDYEAHHLDPMSFTIEHITPLARGGTDTLDNIGPAHRKCNRSKGDSPAGWRPGVTFVTSREW